MTHVNQGSASAEVHAYDNGHMTYVAKTDERPSKPTVTLRGCPNGTLQLLIDGRPLDEITGLRTLKLSLEAGPDGARMVLDCAAETIQIDIEGQLRGLTRGPKTDDSACAPVDKVSQYKLDQSTAFAAFYGAPCGEPHDLRVGNEVAKAAFDTILNGMGVPRELFNLAPAGQPVVMGRYQLESTEFVLADTLYGGRPHEPNVRSGPDVLPQTFGGGLTVEEKRDADTAAAEGWRCVMPTRYPICGDDGKQVGWSDGSPFVPVDFGTGDSGDETDEPIVVRDR